MKICIERIFYDTTSGKYNYCFEWSGIMFYVVAVKIKSTVTKYLNNNKDELSKNIAFPHLQIKKNVSLILVLNEMNLQMIAFV